MTEGLIFQEIFNRNELGCSCSFLELGNFKIIFECGYSPELKDVHIELFKKHLESAKLVIISHCHISNIGLLPLINTTKIQVLITSSALSLGHLTLYDHYYSLIESRPFTLYETEDIDRAIENIQPIQISQTLKFNGNYNLDENCIEIRPFLSGSTVGGAFWKICYRLLTIIYTNQIFLKCEYISKGYEYEMIEPNNCIVIQDCYIKDTVNNKLEESWKMITNDIITNNKIGIIISDTASRALEILLQLKFVLMSMAGNVGQKKIAVLQQRAKQTLEIAGGNLEHMSDKIQKINYSRNMSSNSVTKDPFRDESIVSFSSYQKFKKKLQDFSFIISNPPDANYGYSNKLLLDFAGNSNFVFIFTQKDLHGLVDCLISPTKSPILSLPKNIPKYGEKGDIEPPLLLARRASSISASPMKKQESISRKQSISTNSHLFENKSYLSFNYFPITFDEYGESIFEGDRMFSSSSEMPHSKVTSYNIETIKESSKLKKQQFVKPSFYENKIQQMNLKAQFFYLNNEGIIDQDSLLMIISKILPKQIILYNGSNSKMRYMEKYIRSSLGIPCLVSLFNGLPIQLNYKMISYEVFLPKDFFSTSNLVKKNDITLIPINSKLNLTSSNPQGVTTLEDNTSFSNEEKGFKKYLINKNINIEDLLKLLEENKVPSEIINGELRTISSGLKVTMEKGKIHIEGAISNEYFAIRNIIKNLAFSQYY